MHVALKAHVTLWQSTRGKGKGCPLRRLVDSHAFGQLPPIGKKPWWIGKFAWRHRRRARAAAGPLLRGVRHGRMQTATAALAGARLDRFYGGDHVRRHLVHREFRMVGRLGAH